MKDTKKIIIGMLILAIFVFVVALSSLYVQTQLSAGNACGCFVPLPLFIPFIASVGLFIGTLVYYLFSPRFEIKKIDKNILLNLFDKDERKILNLLLSNKGRHSQAGITQKTEMPKVKVFRTLEKLKQKGVIEKKPYGITNMVELNIELGNLVK